MRKDAGFTLVELMIVIAIIIILAVITMPSFTGEQARSQADLCRANREQIAVYYQYTAAASIAKSVFLQDVINGMYDAGGYDTAKLQCPGGGSYTVSADGKHIVCSIAAHGSTEVSPAPAVPTPSVNAAAPSPSAAPPVAAPTPELTELLDKLTGSWEQLVEAICTSPHNARSVTRGELFYDRTGYGVILYTNDNIKYSDVMRRPTLQEFAAASPARVYMLPYSVKKFTALDLNETGKWSGSAPVYGDLYASGEDLYIWLYTVSPSGPPSASILWTQLG